GSEARREDENHRGDERREPSSRRAREGLGSRHGEALLSRWGEAVIGTARLILVRSAASRTGLNGAGFEQVPPIRSSRRTAPTRSRIAHRPIQATRTAVRARANASSGTGPRLAPFTVYSRPSS